MGLPRAHAHRYGFAGKQASPFKLDLTADCLLMLQRNAPEPQNPRARRLAPAADTNIMANPYPIINLVDRGRIMVDASQKGRRNPDTWKRGAMPKPPGAGMRRRARVVEL